MARSFWKGKVIIPQISKEVEQFSTNIFRSWVISKKVYKPQYSTFKLYRRSQFLNASLINLNLNYRVYNGYDLFDKKPDLSHIGHNIATLVLTRESNVVHKVKLSKEAKRNQQAKLNKKKVLTTKKVKKK